MASKINLAGQIYGRLTVVAEVAERRGEKVVWRCLCSGGAETPHEATEICVTSNLLRRGKVRSCGCLKLTPCPYSALRLEELYKNGLSVQEIATLAETTHKIASRWLATYGIETRSMSEAKRVYNVRFPDYFRKVIAAGLAVRLEMWANGTLNTDHLNTASAHRKKEKTLLKIKTARRVKQQAEQEQSEAIERSLNGETFK